MNDIRCAVKANVSIIQYRNKKDDSLFLYKEAKQIKHICRNSTLFIINDRIDIALAVDADGVHLGQNDLPIIAARKLMGDNKIIGITVHNLKQAVNSYKHGADYIAVSPIFKTNTKKDAGKPLGLNLIKTIRNEIPIPIVAIGGINLHNALKIIEEGVDSICAISSIVEKNDVESEINKYQNLFKQKNNTQ